MNDPLDLHASLVLKAEPAAAGAARRFIADLCNAANLGEDDCSLAALLTSELVTNAIKYGGSRTVLEAKAPGGFMRVSVRDDNPALPVVGESPDLTAESGRGLLLVQALATRWGVEELPGEGKTVWFELDLAG